MPKQPATREPIDALEELLDGFLTARRATAYVEWKDDPEVPGRRAYRITGESRDAVQAAVDARMRTADEAPFGARAHFLGPYRNKEAPGWIALGEVIIRQAEVA
jgi:hypothetical protein